MTSTSKPNSSTSDENIVGSCFTIVFCDGALVSFREALKSTKSKQAARLTVDMKTLLDRLSNGVALSKNNDVSEGALPDKSKFRCLKKIPIRCYYWKSTSHDKTIFVSHFIYKDQQKLQKSDTKKVCDNWYLYE